MNQSAGKQVARAAATVVVFSVASKLLGFVREQVIAGMFSLGNPFGDGSPFAFAGPVAETPRV